MKDLREEERKKHQKHRLAAFHSAPAGDGTHNLLEYGMMLQPTEPPGQGAYVYLFESVFPNLASRWGLKACLSAL